MKVDTKLSISIKNIILYIFGVLERNNDQGEASTHQKKKKEEEEEKEE